MLSVTSVFGKYLKFYVHSSEQDTVQVTSPAPSPACNTMLMCDECGMWRLVYATKNLKAQEIRQLNQFLGDLSFSCGASLEDAHLPWKFEGIVYVCKMACNKPY